MSLRNTPPLLSVLHGTSCENRYLMLSNGTTPYRLSVMVLSVKGGTAWGSLRGKEILGEVIEEVTRWDFSHREANCKNR